MISPEESERIAHTLGTLPEVTTYVAGRSYQGRPVSVMEITLPMEAELVSQAKMSTWKPVFSLQGRQHANEVSATSHILRLAELLVTDPDYKPHLNKMNVVVHPVSNPDGAALAFELQKLTPTHCLHAGRYSALGPDVSGESRNPDTLVTEALVAPKVFNTWLPDVSLNPHGYPSHEWVHAFANYAPPRFRSYWMLPDAVLLSPFESDRTLERFRTFLLPCPDRAARLEALLPDALECRNPDAPDRGGDDD